MQKLSLSLEAASYMVIVGPSGSGKTVLLEAICGLRQVQAGTIVIDGTDVTELEPRAREIGYLPQDYALFPHLSIRNNILFGLRLRAVDQDEMRKRCDALMDMLNITSLAERKPSGLSGGERQRVALARALVLQPRLLLVDEPVSALDSQNRDRVCAELRDIQQQLGCSVIHVCHDFSEMLAVADCCAVCMDGALIQTGAPSDILDRPASVQLARFMQAENVLSVTCVDGSVFWNELTLVAEHARIGMGACYAIIRPEYIQLHATQASSSDAHVGVVISLNRRLNHLLVEIQVSNGAKLLVSTHSQTIIDASVMVGKVICWSVHPKCIHLI